MAGKIIVTHEGAMRQKYGDRWPSIEEAVKRLIDADRARGIDSVLVALDGEELGRRRARTDRPRTFKEAIDYVYGLHGRPDFITILGGPGIVPHQDLRNPLGREDADRAVPSDLPYACDAPAGGDPTTFLSPSRAVARIPDVPGDSDPALLVTLLDLAAGWTPQAVVEEGFFGLSAYVWRKSTRKSLEAVFGRGATPRVSPAAGPQWTGEDLGPLWHFINCHGAPVDARFYGQKSNSYPPAHDATLLPRKIARGTVTAAECCYGVELYDPSAVGTAGICVTYLREGAIGFMGSTNIAYGPANTNAAADLICRFFLKAAHDGASLGHAMLEARQRFVRRVSPVSPIDLKTLAQFLLLGDPSARAVQAARISDPRVPGKAARAAATARRATPMRGVRAAESRSGAPSPQRIQSRLRNQVPRGYVAAGGARTFTVGPAAGSGVHGSASPNALAVRGTARRKRPAPVRFHVMAALPEGVPKRGLRAISTRMILLAREVAGSLGRIERLYAHGPRAAGSKDDSFQGMVIRGPFARGSKSERDAVMLDTGDKQLVLRLKGGNPFKDAVLDELVGHRIRANGVRTGYTLIMTKWVDLKGGARKGRR